MNRRAFLLLIPVAAVAAAQADSSKHFYRVADEPPCGKVSMYVRPDDPRAYGLLTDDELRELAKKWHCRVVTR